MNQKRYWLRGGIIAVVIVVLLIVAVYLKLSVSFPFTGRGGELPNPPGYTKQLILGFGIEAIEVFTISFGIGAFLGWIYGKVKNRQ